MGAIHILDAALASLAREEAALRLRLGQLLDVIGRGAVFELGFSSVGAYAVERCERSVRWAEGARCVALARRRGGVLRTERAAAGARGSAAASRPGGPHPVAIDACLGMGPLESVPLTALDREVRALAEAMARHELDLSVHVLRFHRADGWRRLGYATETQYARERLGLSRSSLQSRRALALRLERLPAVSAALGAAEIGVEAALQLVRTATPPTAAAWIERARRRTIKHLREEVAAALTAVRLSGQPDCPPPADAELAEYQTLERAVVSGRFGEYRPSDAPGSEKSRRTPGVTAASAWSVMLASLASWLDGAPQTSAAGSGPTWPRARASAGRVTLRLHMSRETYAWWRGLEAQTQRWLPPGMSWLRFLCLSVWHGSRHSSSSDVAYAHIYIRDRYRCRSPVCNRRDVTPHHLRFRSAGGSDEDDNIATLCTWCHLYGIHGGRIRATGSAELIHWELGARESPSVVVHGRERLAA